MHRWLEGWTEDRWTDAWMGGQVNGWIGGWVDGWMGGKMDGWVGFKRANLHKALSQC